MVGALALVAAVAAAEDEEIAVLDDCKPTSFNAAVGPGTCTINGDVMFSEFLSVLPPGHPAWRNEPSYLKIAAEETVVVTNGGGERHTFTEVAKFGGGIVPPLNKPLGFTGPVPECNPTLPTFNGLRPGASLEVTGLGVGTHLFQCCIHPWMRAAIKVKADQD